MNKESPISRKQVSHELVSDDFFSLNKRRIKYRQRILSILAWTGLAVPFIWLLIPFLWPKLAKLLHFQAKASEINELKSFSTFFLIAFAVILLGSIILTIHNNNRQAKVLAQSITHDEKLLEKREQILSEFYTERFGSKEMRENVKFYSVKEEQNLDDDTVKDLYRDRGASL
ncbi:hypothetical protein [Lentilactobacillus senioris]|nr:hypothetical protein [Lentilactobacillus senioris]